MTVQAILAQKGGNVITAENSAKISDVVDILAARGIGAILIKDNQGHVCGIISERDIVREISQNGAEVLNRQVSTCMTSDVVSCTSHNTINEVMEIMTTRRFRHLPVMEDGELHGFISIGDVVKQKIQQIEQEAEDIKSYIAAT